MRSYDELWNIAVTRKGEDVLRDRLPTCKTPEELAAIPDDRYLSAMTKRVFSAGFVWRVVDAKWDGFEEAFRGFDPIAVVALGEGAPELLEQDARIIRNGQKIRATYENARFVMSIADEYDSFGRFVADWPSEDIVGLWSVLKKRGKRLGGDSGPRFLRQMGKDTFILTHDVVRSLTDQGVLQGKATSAKAQRAAQEAFVAWKAESGRPFGEISVVLACTVGENR